MSWRIEYLTALECRDEREKAQCALLDSYSRLADRVSALQSPETGPRSTAVDASDTRREVTGPGPSIDQIRADLAAAQRSKVELRSKLEIVEASLATLQRQYTTGAQRISALSTEKTVLSQRVKDQNEELRGKAKLLEEVQDEMLSLQLQLNVAEEKYQVLYQENKQLVERWMTKVGQEADALNQASKYT